MNKYFYNDKGFIEAFKHRGILLALDEYIRHYCDESLREAILSRYIWAFELNEQHYRNLMTTDIESTKCVPHAFDRVQKYWPDLLKDNYIPRIRFFFAELIQEQYPYHYTDMHNISLILAELP